MKSLTIIICIFSYVSIIANTSLIKLKANHLFEITQTEKKLIATYDSFDGETFNFIGIDSYGEEFFFVVENINDTILSEFDLKSDSLNGVKFEIHYTESKGDDSGNTQITITKLIKS